MDFAYFSSVTHFEHAATRSNLSLLNDTEQNYNIWVILLMFSQLIFDLRDKVKLKSMTLRQKAITAGFKAIWSAADSLYDLITALLKSFLSSKGRFWSSLSVTLLVEKHKIISSMTMSKQIKSKEWKLGDFKGSHIEWKRPSSVDTLWFFFSYGP